MINLAQKLKTYLPKIGSGFLPEDTYRSFDVLKSRTRILNELSYCQKTGNLAGVYSEILGSGMFLVGVDRIIQGDDGYLVIFHSHDMSGVRLNRQTLTLEEIAAIVPFNNPYVRPSLFNTVSPN